ncbi:hypothetical protein PIROE2DRAFT_63754 [Piromyces sp. E2]|nr:hypothetical protein PIROE2DRAFT_63754 [Piromyces sp. E2]|eukprot:OUM59473.1 hypothetical protein PIROE2DRAFT_63754 [Piromyces sp. E2]
MPLNIETLNTNYLNYKLINCNNNICKETVGYIKFKDYDGSVKYLSLTPSINTIITEEEFDQLSSNELCIIGDIDIDDTGNNKLNSYLLNVPDPDNSIFSDYTSKNIIINTYNNIIYYDNNYYDVGINIFNGNKKINIKNISKNCEKLSIYYCKNDGICQILEGRVKNNDDYYYIDYNGTSYKIEDSSFGNEKSFVTKCETNKYGNIIDTSYELCTTNNKSIPFVTNNKINYYVIAKDEDNFKFVRAIKDVFGLNPINGKIGLNVINTITGETIDLNSSSSQEIGSYLNDIALFNCYDLNTSIECDRTYGYIISGDNNYFKISYDGSNEKEGLSFALNNEGKLNSDDYIISSSKTFNNFENDNEYILIKGGSDHYIYDSRSTAGIKITNKGKIIDIDDISEVEDMNNLGIYYCTVNSICTSLEGYVNNSEGYYKIESNGNVIKLNDDSVYFVDICNSENLGKLMRATFNICLGGEISDSSNNVDYIVKENKKYKYIDIYDDNLIIKVDIDNNTINEKINLMDVSNRQIVPLPINSDISTINLSNYILFNCNEKMDLCKQTVGYIKDDDDTNPNYYSIFLDPNENQVITKDENNCNYSDGNWSDNIYILSKPDESDSVFKEDHDKNIIIKSTNNVIYKNNIYEDYDVNIFINNNKIAGTENITDDIIAKSSSLYLCNINGECQGVEGYIRNDDYYYRIDTNSPNNSGRILSEDLVNDCSSQDENIGSLLNTGEICISKTKSIPFAESATENKNYILFDKNDDEKLLRSFPNVFIIQDFSTDSSKITDGINIIDINYISPKIIDLTSIEVGNILNIYSLYNCDTTDKECKQTIGYIKDKLERYYSILLNPSKNTPTKTINCDNNNGTVGGLSKEDNNICIKINTNDKNDYYIAKEWDNETYILDIPDSNDSIFKDYSSKNIIVKGKDNVVLYYDNLYKEAGLNMYLYNTLDNEISNDLIKYISLYLCNMNGECQGVEGYIKNNDEYYYINTLSPNNNTLITSVESDINNPKPYKFVSNCSSNDKNVGYLLSKGEICISKRESIPFTTTENKNYLFYDKNEQINLLRSSPNMFIKQNIYSGKI